MILQSHAKQQVPVRQRAAGVRVHVHRLAALAAQKRDNKARCVVKSCQKETELQDMGAGLSLCLSAAQKNSSYFSMMIASYYE